MTPTAGSGCSLLILSLVATCAASCFVSLAVSPALSADKQARNKILYPDRPRYSSRPELAFTPQIPRGARSVRQPAYSSLHAHGTNVCRIWLKGIVVRCADPAHGTAEARLVQALITMPTPTNRRNLEHDLASAGVPVIDGVPATAIIRRHDNSTLTDDFRR